MAIHIRLRLAEHVNFGGTGQLSNVYEMFGQNVFGEKEIGLNFNMPNPLFSREKNSARGVCKCLIPLAPLTTLAHLVELSVHVFGEFVRHSCQLNKLLANCC